MNTDSTLILPKSRRAVDRPFAVVACCCAIAFGLLWVVVALSRGPLVLDRPAAIAIQDAYPTALAPFDTVVSWLGGAVETIAGLSFALAACILVRRATRLVVFSLGYSLVYDGVNVLVRRPRPTGLPHIFQHIGAYSFPSGHVAFVIWVCTLSLLLYARHLPRPLYLAAWVVALVLVVLAGLSRIAVGAHWPSDVLGGILVGIGWMSLTLSIHWLTKPLFGDEQPKDFMRRTLRSRTPPT
jgi:undecaprenyl-diphosphatase